MEKNVCAHLYKWDWVEIKVEKVTFHSMLSIYCPMFDDDIYPTQLLPLPPLLPLTSNQTKQLLFLWPNNLFPPPICRLYVPTTLFSFWTDQLFVVLELNVQLILNGFDHCIYTSNLWFINQSIFIGLFIKWIRLRDHP